MLSAYYATIELGDFMKLERYLETIWLLLQRRSMTAQQLAEHFEVSIRTIYRDLDVLSAAGIPLYTEKGRGGGIRLMDDFILNRTYLTDYEQKEVLAALQGFKQLYDPHTPTLHKLTALFPSLEIDWLHVDFTHWSMNSDYDLFDQLKQAILKCQCLQITYINNEGVESERLIDPYQFIFKGTAWYIYAYCHVRQSFRTFKISRITSFTILDEYFERKPLPTLPAMPKATPQYTYTLKIDASMGFRVVDEFNHENYTRDEEGNFIVKDTFFPDENWLVGYVLSFGNACELLEPAFLRDEISKQLQACLAMYK